MTVVRPLSHMSRPGAGHSLVLLTAAALLVSGLWLVAARPAAATEARIVADGAFVFQVGLLTEPAYVGQPNGLLLRILETLGADATPGATPSASPVTSTPAATPGAAGEDVGTPLTGLERALKVEISTGTGAATVKQTLPLVPVADQPGTYLGRFVPTVAGAYAFRITGTIENRKLDETFQSSPESFAAVTALTDIQFPPQQPLDQRLTNLHQAASRAQTLGKVGIALGVIGLLAGALALALSRRPPPGGWPIAAAIPDPTPLPPDPVAPPIGAAQPGDE